MRRYWSDLRFGLLAGLLLALPIIGCQSLGLVPAQTTDQKIAYAYAGVTAALSTIAAATYPNGPLSADQAQNANTLALNVKSILDTARVEEAANASQAATDLALALTALTAVQTYLTNQGVK